MRVAAAPGLCEVVLQLWSYMIQMVQHQMATIMGGLMRVAVALGLFEIALRLRLTRTPSRHIGREQWHLRL